MRRGLSSSSEHPSASGAPPPKLADLLARSLDSMHGYVQVTLGPELRTKEAVSDIVQSAVHDMLRDAERFEFRSDGELRVYLQRALDHKISNKRRHYATLKRSGAEVPVSVFEHLLTADRTTPSELVMSSEALERLRTAIDALGEDDRRLLSAHKILGLTVAEIARDWSVPATTLHSRIARIMATLAVRLRTSLGET